MMTNSTTKVYDEALQERVRKYMKDTGLSQNKLAPRIGMSGASLSNYMNCKMDGSVEGIESRLREFLQQESEAAAVQVQVAPYKLDETYKPTSISEDVYQSIRYAQINRTLVMLHGDAGAGKTKAAVSCEPGGNSGHTGAAFQVRPPKTEPEGPAETHLCAGVQGRGNGAPALRRIFPAGG